MAVTVRWGTDRFEFELPAPDTTLAAVRTSIAQYLQLQHNAFRLVHDGAVMADDNASISAYYLRPHSIITVVAENTLPVPPKNSEQAQIVAIRAEVTAVNTRLVPAHTAFLHDLPIHPKSSLAKEQARIGELLLQALLRLDGIVPEHDWHHARADRKAAVKLLQSLLDQLDAAWADKL